MEDSIMLMEPREWGAYHSYLIAENGFSATPYSTKQNKSQVEIRLNNLSRPEGFNLYLYIQKTYRCQQPFNEILKGSGKIEFIGKVIDYKVSENRISCPWKMPKTPVVPKNYNRYQDLKYEFWFKVKSLDRCDLDYSQFNIYKDDGCVGEYPSLERFAGSWRGKIIFVERKFN